MAESKTTKSSDAAPPRQASGYNSQVQHGNEPLPGDAETTEPKDLADWVAELSNYQGNTIGQKMAHRMDVMRRFRNQTIDEIADVIDSLSDLAHRSHMIGNTVRIMKDAD